MTSPMQAIDEDEVVWRAHKSHSRAPAAFHAQGWADRNGSLTALIENEIIPHLVAAHAVDARKPLLGPAAQPTISAADVETLVALSVEVEADVLLAHVETILARGVPVDAVLVDLLAPAARRLGEYWEEDRSDFVDVTMALWRLQEIVHELADQKRVAHAERACTHRALFAAMPGDQHSFGAVVIDEVFRRGGWHTERIIGADTADLLHRSAADWFDLIGLTLSCDCHIRALGSIIAALRNVSCNPRVCIMVGGRVFLGDPVLATEVGADGTARDARIALRLAESLVRAREREAAACS